MPNQLIFNHNAKPFKCDLALMIHRVINKYVAKFNFKEAHVYDTCTTLYAVCFVFCMDVRKVTIP